MNHMGLSICFVVCWAVAVTCCIVWWTISDRLLGRLFFYGSIRVHCVKCYLRPTAIAYWHLTESGKNKPLDEYCTGFIFHYENHGCFIMSSANFLNELFNRGSVEKYNNESIITATFYDPNENRAAVHDVPALILHVDFGHDISIMKVENVIEKPVVVFGGVEEEGDGYVRGLPVYTVSHPLCHNTLQPFVFALGRISQTCLPVPSNRLDDSCHCLAHNVPTNYGSYGAPICDHKGVLIGIHSSKDTNVIFAVGLKSIKKVLIDFFKLPGKHINEAADRLLMVGLDKQKAKKMTANKKKKKSSR